MEQLTGAGDQKATETGHMGMETSGYELYDKVNKLVEDHAKGIALPFIDFKILPTFYKILNRNFN